MYCTVNLEQLRHTMPSMQGKIPLKLKPLVNYIISVKLEI